jgi:hypothetical protein
MRRLLVILLFPLGAFAHPGIGIVKDSRGAIYYTDLKQVWKIGPEGHKQVVVPDVHTHELFIDSNDNLYGEHLWYNGERVDTWGHYVWRLSSNGVLDTLIGPKDGFLEKYSFVRDGHGNMYWVERFTISRFKKKAPDGLITTIAEGKFKNVRWMHATPEGVLYFIDLTDLHKIEPNGKISLMARDITEKSAAFAGVGRAHALFGIWTDKANNIYVANYSGQVVKRIRSNGPIENAVYSQAPWSPTGGVFDEKGNLWLLETSYTNEVRVRKVPSSAIGEKKPASVVVSNYLMPILAALALVTLLFLLVRWGIKILRPQAV